MNQTRCKIDTRCETATSLAGRFCQAYNPAAGLEDRYDHAMEDVTMPRVKQASKSKRVTKAAVPALGAAGLTLSLVGGASAAAVPTADVKQAPNYAPTQALTLGEEEIADVSLATFHLFDKENTGAVSGAVQMAWGCRCGGCRGCRGCAGCRACRGCAGCGGCGGSCCASWGLCRLC
jgi:hypothetical protein